MGVLYRPLSMIQTKSPFSIGAIIMLLILPILPTTALASHNNEPHWGRNNSLQPSITALGSNPVTNIPIPILFGVATKNLTRNFGELRAAGHAHEGLDIMSPEGTPIVSPSDAVVTRTGVWSGAGLFVETAVPGNETFTYMHLSKIADIKEGDILKKGDLIGFVGYTGNAIATAPHLHFEIRDINDVPSDPFPRINTIFETNEKMSYLQVILNKATNSTELADFLITKFKSEFTSAKAMGIALPAQIETALSKITPVIAPVVQTSSTVTLRVGSRGPAVVALQTFLVAKNVGSAYKVKPDGAFGPITKQALIDYQKSVGLGADGVYGPKSRAYVIAHP